MVQDCLLAGWIQLEDGSELILTSDVSGPVNVSCRIPRHGRPGLRSITRRSREAMQYRFVIGSVQLENYSIPKGAAHLGGAVEIARRVPHHTGPGTTPIYPAHK